MKKDYTKQLDEFTKKLEKIPEIIAVYYTGSTASKTWDEYSDIDIDIVMKDEDYDKIVKRLPEILSWWGEIKLINYYKDCDEAYAFIGEDYIKVEIDPIKLSLLKPKIEFKNIRIAFDKEGTIREIYKKSQNEKSSILDYEEFIHILLDTRSNFIYAARHYARGQKLSGVSALGDIGGKLFYYLGKIKGMEGYENIRLAEKHLTKKEWNFLKKSKCKSHEKKEFIRALKVSWEYMKYVEKLYEEKSKIKLKLNCNDDEILGIIMKNFRINKQRLHRYVT